MDRGGKALELALAKERGARVQHPQNPSSIELGIPLEMESKLMDPRGPSRSSWGH